MFAKIVVMDLCIFVKIATKNKIMLEYVILVEEKQI